MGGAQARRLRQRRMQPAGSRCYNLFGSSCWSALYADSFEEQRLRYQTSTDNATAPILKKHRANDTLRTRDTSDMLMAHISTAYRSTILQTLRCLSQFSRWTFSEDHPTHIFRNKAIILWQCCNVIVILTSGHVIFNLFLHF